MNEINKRHQKENAEERAKVEAYFAKIFAPLTPEEQVFFNGSQWLVFDADTHSDTAFDSKEAALAFASGDLLTVLVAGNLDEADRTGAELLADVLTLNPSYDPAKRAQARHAIRTA